MSREQKTFILNVGKLEYKVNTLVCKVNEEWQKKEELEILLANIETKKLELKAYFMSLITGNRVKVDFKIEDELNGKLQGYVIIAKGYVLKANKEFKRLSFILNNIFLKIQIFFKNFDLINIELKIRKIIISDLGNIISNLNIILFQLTELFNIISNLNTMILLSLKDQDKELHEEVNTNIINLRLLFDETVNEVILICELNLKLCVEKENVLFLPLNVSNVDNIAGFVGIERNQIREIEQINNLNKFELFTNQVKNMLIPLREGFKNDINIISYMSDIWFKLNYIQSEINSDVKIKNELGSIVNDGLNEIQGQLNLYMISKLKEQVKRIHVDIGYKFKEFKIYITGLIQKKDLIDLGEQSISKDFADLSEFFLKFNDRLWYYLEFPYKNRYSVNFFDKLFSQLQTKLNQFKILKIEELIKCLNREKKKNYKRQIYKEINEEILLYLKNEKYIEKEKKEIKVYLVSPLDKINNMKIDINDLLNEARVYIISPLKRLKAELQAYPLFLLRNEIKILISKLIFFKEIPEVAVDEDVFFSMHELNYQNKNLREEVSVEIKNIIINIKKEIQDMFFPMDMQIHVDEDVKIFFSKIQAYKRIKASLRIQAKEEFAEFFEKTKAKHEIKDIILKIYYLYNQLEELEIILLYLITLNFFALKKNIQICPVKKMKI